MRSKETKQQANQQQKNRKLLLVGTCVGGHARCDATQRKETGEEPATRPHRCILRCTAAAPAAAPTKTHNTNTALNSTPATPTAESRPFTWIPPAYRREWEDKKMPQARHQSDFLPSD
jgi:hypothetical protein